MNRQQINRRRIRRKRRRDGLWNRLSCGIVVLFIALAGYVVYIFANPTSALNPFPPRTEVAEITLPTFDETLQNSAGTLTPTTRPSATPTLEVNTPTPEPSPTEEQVSVAEPTPIPVTSNSHNPATTPIPTKVLHDEFPFTLQGEPKFLDASTFNPRHGCNWQGIAGQTFDMLNRPLPGKYVQVSGKLGGETLEMINMSGTMLTYGDAGYEVFLADQVIESHETLTIRMIDQEGKPISPSFKLNTSSACNQNLVVVNFKQVK